MQPKSSSKNKHKCCTPSGSRWAYQIQQIPLHPNEGSIQEDPAKSSQETCSIETPYPIDKVARRTTWRMQTRTKEDSRWNSKLLRDLHWLIHLLINTTKVILPRRSRWRWWASSRGWTSQKYYRVVITNSTIHRIWTGILTTWSIKNRIRTRTLGLSTVTASSMASSILRLIGDQFWTKP